MDKCLKMLGLFSKRAKILYLNGYSKFQIFNELNIFLEKQTNFNLTKLDLNNTIFNHSKDKLQLERKVNQHYCNELYLDNEVDNLFLEINKATKNINYDNFKELKLIDKFLDNPRIKDINI